VPNASPLQTGILLLAALVLALVAAFFWVDPPSLWALVLANGAWLISIAVAFKMLGRRGAWTLLTGLLVVPVALFYGTLWYSCAVNAACP
jgi:hypothetical protein